jgi:hypothetical protein
MNQETADKNKDFQLYKIYDDRKAVLDDCSQSMHGTMAALNREISLCRQSLHHTRKAWDDLESKSRTSFEMDQSSIITAGIIDFAGAVGL